MTAQPEPEIRAWATARGAVNDLLGPALGDELYAQVTVCVAATRAGVFVEDESWVLQLAPGITRAHAGNVLRVLALRLNRP